VNEAPTCLKYELPTFGWYGAGVASVDDGSNTYQGELQNWTVRKGFKNPQSYMIPKYDLLFYAYDTLVCAFPGNCAGLLAEKLAQKVVR